MKAFDANDLPPSPIEAPEHGAPTVPDLKTLDGAGAPKRRDLRDRILLGGAALLAVGALGTSLLALQREVPFLDVAVERASAQGDIDTPLAATVPTRPPSTTSTSTTAAPTTTTTTAPTTTVPEVLAALAATTTTAQPELALDDAGTEADDPAWSDEDDATPAVPAPVPTAGPAPTVWVPPTPEPTAPTAPPGETTSTTAPGTTTTAGPTTTTAPAPVVLQVALTCKNNTTGLTLTLTPNGDGTLQKVRVATFPTACKNKPVKAVLLDGGGQTLATFNGQIRNSSPYTLTISGWPPVAVNQIAVVSLVNP